MHWNTRWQWLLSAVLLITFIACNDISNKEPLDNQAQKMDVPLTADSAAEIAPELEDNQQQAPAPRQPKAAASTITPSEEDWDKKIVKNGKLTIEVKDFEKFNEQVRNAVKQSGGYVSQEDQNQSDYKIENVVTIKVPVAQFEEAMHLLAPNNEKIVMRKITSQDVTMNYVDTRARLETKREVHRHYIDMLRQAKDIGDALKVQEQASSLQEDIDAAAGRVRYLSHTAAFSTIELNYYQVLKPEALQENEKEPGFGDKVLQALGGGLKWVGEAFVVLLSLWPLWALALAALWIYRKYRANQVKPAANTVATAPVNPANTDHKI